MDTPLSLADGVIILFVSLSALLAMARGFTREALGIFSLVGSFILANYTAEPLAPLLSSVFDLSPLAAYLKMPIKSISVWICYGILIIFYYVILGIFTHWASEKAKGSVVGVLDRILGFVFGTVRGLLFISLMFWVYSSIIKNPKDYNEAILNARSLFIMQAGADFIRDIIPDDLKSITQTDTPIAPADEKLSIPPLKFDDKDTEKGYNPEDVKTLLDAINR